MSKIKFLEDLIKDFVKEVGEKDPLETKVIIARKN